MSKAVKRGNNWNVRVYDYTDPITGKQHNKSFTAPTKAEAEFLAAQYKATKNHHSRTTDMTVREAVDKYIQLKALLSPTTTDSYKSISDYAFADLMNIKVSKLNDLIVQREINKEAVRIGQKGTPISPKTVKNEWTLISASLKLICHREFYVTLPKYQKHIKDYPDPPKVIQAIVGTDIELPCFLAAWLSFRMGEVRGIMCSDINLDKGEIKINGTVVDTRQGAVRKDTAKTPKSLRGQDIPPYIIQLINNTDTYIKYRETGENAPLIPLTRSQIYGRWQTICKQNNLELSFHDLRHYAASIRDFLGFPFKLLQEDGGWSSLNIALGNYAHPFDEERKYYHDKLNEYFEKIIAEKNIPPNLPHETENH